MLNAQQRTRIQQTVLASSNVPRVNNVNFAVSVGTVVPTSVRVLDVGPALIEINPQWRGHQYFVVSDDIIIVDRSHKIVAVVPVGSSGGGGAQLGGAGSGPGALNLTPDQIREIQIVLNEKGFNIGRPDGVLGTRTTQALIAFQRQQGFQASGRIDSQTVTALGLSNKIGVQGGAQGAGQSSTTGQGGANQQQAPAQQNQSTGQQPSTSGQGGASQQQAPAQQNQGAGQQPSTSGQDGASQQQAPAQQNQGANQPSTGGQGGANQQAPAQQNQPAAGQGQQNSGSK
jgi:peptidoglycan hydrolase-like protein with peptidoglycan-binding domain